MTNGCHNHPPYRQRVVVQDGWYMDGVTRVAKMVQVPFKMSPDCQYSKSGLGKADPGCNGCKHRQ
jgi:hypothetical protein